MHSSEFACVRISVFSDAKERCAQRPDGSDLGDVQGLPPFSPSGTASASSLPNKDDLDARPSDTVTMRLDDPRCSAIDDFHDVSPGDGVAEPHVHGLLTHFPKRAFDDISGLCHGDVLPDPNHCPPVGGESFVDPSVPEDVALELRRPVVHVSLGFAAMLRAPMPPAAVHEHSDACRREHEVGANPNRSGDDRAVHAVPPPAPMELSPQREFWPGIPTPVPAHRC